MVEARHKYQAYAAATQTVAKTKQIVLLYDAVIRYVQQGKDAVFDQRIEDRFNILTKAANIIAGLQASLDFEQGGEVARVLFNYYLNISGRIFSLHRISRAEGLELCDRIIGDLKQMRDIWHGIDQQNSDAQTGGPAALTAPVVEAAEQSITLSA